LILRNRVSAKGIGMNFVVDLNDVDRIELVAVWMGEIQIIPIYLEMDQMA
jgi:hypothetical protein